MIDIEAVVPWNELQQQVRQTTLLKDRDGEPVYPYLEAEIDTVELPYALVRPTSKYVLRPNLAMHAALAYDLAQHGENPLDLEYGLDIVNDHGELHKLTPPIVEDTLEDGVYVLDGAHRTTLGRWAGRKTFTAIYIRGVRPDCPSYAKPNNWDDIKIYETLPAEKYLKKDYRDNAGSLYRNSGPINDSAYRKDTTH